MPTVRQTGHVSVSVRQGLITGIEVVILLINALNLPLNLTERI